MKTDFTFHGKWLIRYDPGEFAYPEILSLLAALQVRLQSQKLNFRTVHLTIGRDIVRNRFFPFADRLFIAHNGVDQRLAETDPGAFAVRTDLEPLAAAVRSINLLFPLLESDPRWKTLDLPAAQLFLASGLQAAGFAVSLLPLRLPAPLPPPGAPAADMAGFTLFEDLLPSLRPFLADFHVVFKGYLAAGGPFPTLAPLAAVYHLPQVNLFVRGEAEIALPLILDALNRGDADALFKAKGLFWQRPGLIVISDFDKVNRPKTFTRFAVDFAFLRPEQLQHGLEMNFSRGCGRGCVFCCRVQGHALRRLPLAKAEELLKQYRDKVDHFSDIRKGVPLERPVCISARAISDRPGRPGNFVCRQIISAEADDLCCGSPLPKGESPACIPVNINDDDILQDPAYAAAIFALIKKHGFRIHGIQTSPASLLESDGRVKTVVLDLAADRDLYFAGRPLVWLGTDAFLQDRAKRLGKRLPGRENFTALLAEFEKRGLRHFHYWIASDGDSTWEEFVDELALVFGFYRDFSGFGLLAHAPFVVPYPASRMFGRLEADDQRLKVKLALEATDPRFSYQVIERLETKYVNLNKLLKNERAGGEKGFFDLLKAKDFIAAAQIAYHFLKQEQLQSVDSKSGNLTRSLVKLEELIQKII